MQHLTLSHDHASTDSMSSRFEIFFPLDKSCSSNVFHPRTQKESRRFAPSTHRQTLVTLSPQLYTIDSFVAAMSKASTSAVNLANAFLVPSGRIRVLILTVSTSYNFFNASLICCLLALVSTMKTRVLFSSIFFMALSVFRGWMRILWWSSRVS